jgi:hypothetical protein
MVTECVSIAPPMLVETAHAIPPIVPNPLEEGCGRIPGIKEHKIGGAAQALAGIAQPVEGQGIC